MQKNILTEKDLKKYVEGVIKEYLELEYPSYNDRTMKPYLIEGLTMTYAPWRVCRIFLSRFQNLINTGRCGITYVARRPKHEPKDSEIFQGEFKKRSKPQLKTDDGEWSTDTSRGYDGWYEIILNVKYNANITKKEFQKICQFFDSCGWVFTNFIRQQTPFQMDNIEEIGNEPYKIRFEAKYSPKLSEDEIPKYGYHFAPTRAVPKILRDGLKPKDGIRSAKHPERLYLWMNKMSNWKEVLHNFKGDIKEPYSLLKVKLPKRLEWYHDENHNSRFGPAMWTWETIPGFYIEVIDHE